MIRHTEYKLVAAVLFTAFLMSAEIHIFENMCYGIARGPSSWPSTPGGPGGPVIPMEPTLPEKPGSPFSPFWPFGRLCGVLSCNSLSNDKWVNCRMFWPQRSSSATNNHKNCLEYLRSEFCCHQDSIHQSVVENNCTFILCIRSWYWWFLNYITSILTKGIVNSEYCI